MLHGRLRFTIPEPYICTIESPQRAHVLICVSICPANLSIVSPVCPACPVGPYKSRLHKQGVVFHVLLQGPQSVLVSIGLREVVSGDTQQQLPSKLHFLGTCGVMAAHATSWSPLANPGAFLDSIDMLSCRGRCCITTPCPWLSDKHDKLFSFALLCRSCSAPSATAMIVSTACPL